MSNPYQMLPNNTIVKCQLISHSGDFIKGDLTDGNEIVTARVCDQRIFKTDILYWVEGIDENSSFYQKKASTRHSLIDFNYTSSKTKKNKNNYPE